MKASEAIIPLIIRQGHIPNSDKPMNHLESSFTGKNNIWRYVIMLCTIFLVMNTLGGIPLYVKIFLVSVNDPAAAASFARQPNNPALLGISPNTGLIMMLLPFAAGLLAFFLLIKPIHKKTFTSIVNGTGTIRWKRFFAGAFVWLAISFAYLFMYLEIDPDNIVLKNRSETLIALIVISLVFFTFQAGLEEVIFRGYLMQGLALVVRQRWFPLLVTSVFFGLLHAFNPEVKDFGFFTMIPHYILFGLVFGITTVLDDGIEVAAGAHAINNAFLSVMITHKSSALQTDSVFEQIEIHPWTELAMLLIMGLLFIFIMKYLLGWKDFSLLFTRVEKKSTVQIP